MQVSQQDQKKPPEKDKGKEKEKEPAPPVVSFEVPPQERSNITERRLPRAPELLGDMPPAPVFFTMPGLTVTKTFQTIIQLPNFPPFNGQTIVNNVTVQQQGPPREAVVPGTRSFKVADNGGPRPQDRVYFSFNYYDDLLAATNARLGADVRNLALYHEHFGIEKTFLGGNASISLQVPLNTLKTQSGLDNINGTHTGLGDLSVILRYALYRDDDNDNWLTGGLAITTPTGPSTIAGIDIPGISHSTILQPFLGYLWNFGDLYVQGVIAVDTPTDARDVTLLFNDLAVGYFLYRTAEPGRLLTAVAPAFEVHATNPLNHRGPIGAANPLTDFDMVNLGLAANIEIAARSRLGVGVVTPVTGPKPFKTEAIVQFRFSY